MLGRGRDKILDFFIILNLSKIWKNGLFLVIINTTKKAGVFIMKYEESDRVIESRNFLPKMSLKFAPH